MNSQRKRSRCIRTTIGNENERQESSTMSRISLVGEEMTIYLKY